MPQPQFKALIWDLGQVAFFFPAQPWLDAWRSVPRVSRALADTETSAAERDVAASQRRFETGATDLDGHRLALSAALGLSPALTWDEFEHGYLRAEVLTINRPLFAAQAEIARLGVAQAVVSNLCPVWHEVLYRAGAMDHLNVELYSYAEGMVKPNEELIVRAVDRLGVRAEDSAFIDDVAANLASATACGTATHLYESNRALAAWLAGVGFPRSCWEPLTRGGIEKLNPVWTRP